MESGFTSSYIVGRIKIAYKGPILYRFIGGSGGGGGGGVRK